MLGFGVVWWSVATVLTPLAAGLGLPALLLARACMGVGEGVAMPAMNNLLSRRVTLIHNPDPQKLTTDPKVECCSEWPLFWA